MMSDLIDRQAAIDALDKRFDGVPMELTTEILQLRRDLRERIPSAQPATNCSEIPNGSDDTISRQAAIDALRVAYWDDNIQSAKDDPCIVDAMTDWAIRQVKALPPAQPEIIYCKDCVKHNKRIGDYVEKSDGTYDWIWKDQACPLAEFRGKAQGHEFDYQFCAYAERREVTEWG